MSTRADDGTIRILTVDDRPDNLTVLRGLIEEGFPGSVVQQARSAQEGLALAAADPPDAALIDVQMPQMDGLEMVRRLKASAETSRFPILLLTAHQSSSQMRAEALDAGADDFLTKPIDNIELLAKIRVMLRIKRAEDGLRELNAELEQRVQRRTEQLEHSRDKLRQAEKLEAIGRLAGGVAHDFNNLLTAIIGNAQLLELETASDPSALNLAGQIITASQRAADLTKQLLAFARKGKWQTVPVSVDHTVQEVRSLISRTCDRRIQIDVEAASEPLKVHGDPSQLQNAVLNLAINACDAMPDGGMLRLQARRRLPEELNDEQRDRLADAPAYVELTVTDTGRGMDDETLRHIFEPFFTTKDRGQGTGLGLPSVYGCVEAHGGSIDVSSASGAGTSFRLLLPAQPVAAPSAGDQTYTPTRGLGRILLVDDEEIIRTCTARALESLGYTVVCCADGAEAIDICRREMESIDLVILDLIMPRVNGSQAARRLLEMNPDLPILLSSGYDDAAAVGQAIEGVSGMLRKPYEIRHLAEAVAGVLSGDRDSSPFRCR